MIDAEVIAKDLLVAYLGAEAHHPRVITPQGEGAKTGEWIGDAFVAIVKKLREGRKKSTDE